MNRKQDGFIGGNSVALLVGGLALGGLLVYGSLSGLHYLSGRPLPWHW